MSPWRINGSNGFSTEKDVKYNGTHISVRQLWDPDISCYVIKELASTYDGGWVTYQH